MSKLKFKLEIELDGDTFADVSRILIAAGQRLADNRTVFIAGDTLQVFANDEYMTRIGEWRVS